MAIFDIPDDVLKHVARPSAGVAVIPAPGAPSQLPLLHPDVEAPLAAEAPAAAREIEHGALLSFEDDSAAKRPPLLISPLARLACFEYFAALLSGRWATSGTFAVPIDRELFTALLAVIETGDLPPLAPPTDALLLALHAAADELGADTSALHVLLPPAAPMTRLPYRADLYALRPAWWRVDAEEEDRMARSQSSDGALVRVDAALAAALRYAPLTKAAGVWLFPGQPPAVAAEQAGFPVLVNAPSGALAAALPRLVAALLRAHPDHMVLAGGAVTGACSQVAPEGADFDLFLHSISPDGADATMARVRASAAEAGYSETISSCAATFAAPADTVGCEAKPFQLILGLHRDRAQVLESFDLAPCKVLARYVKTELVIEALPAWTEALRAMAFWVDTTAWSAAAVARIVKYVAKGFECAVPGTRGVALAARTQAYPSWLGMEPQVCPDARRDINAGDFSIASLFDAEAGHVYGTLGEGSGGEHYCWPPVPGASPRALKANPSRLGLAGAAAIAAALADAPELDVDFSTITNKRRARRGGGMFGSGYGVQYTYKFFWGPAQREAHATTGSMVERNAAVAALFEVGAKSGTPETLAAAAAAAAAARVKRRSGGGGASAGSSAVQLPWQTVRGVARFAPLDAGMAALHDPAKLLAIAVSEHAERALRAAGGSDVLGADHGKGE